MAILSTIKKIRPYIKTATGYVKLKLFADDVVTNSGKTVQDEINTINTNLSNSGIGDDKWYTLTSEITYKKKNGIVFVRGDCRGTNTIPKNSGEKTVGTLPPAYRPGWLYYIPANPISINGGYNLSVRIDSNGNIVMVNFNPNSEVSYWSFLICYPV